MKNTCLRLVITFILTLAGGELIYAQEAKTYASVLIIVPSRPQQQQVEDTVAFKERKETTQEKISSEDIKTSE